MRSKSVVRQRAQGLIALLITLCGCSGGSLRRVYPDKPDVRAGERAIELYDANKDGLLDAVELEKVPGLKAALQKLDLDKDGKISAVEISARVRTWADSKVGRIGVSCKLTHNGQPLMGATVKFIPESFLGGELKSAEGTTDAFGMARMSTPASGQRGICPGFYRVEITKAGDAVPPRYNTETCLGQEIASDASGLNNGVATIDLKY